MLECWKEDKQRPTMKELVEVVRGWDTSTWDSDVVPTPVEREAGEGGADASPGAMEGKK